MCTKFEVDIFAIHGVIACQYVLTKVREKTDSLILFTLNVVILRASHIKQKYLTL